MSTYLYALCIAGFFLIVHIVSLNSNFYMAWAPYDIFMHILGGFVIGLFLYALIRSNSWDLNRKRWFIMAGVLLGGFLWELFEIHYDIAGHPFGTKLYYIDTAKDLIDDLAGGLLIALIWCRGLEAQTNEKMPDLSI